MAIVAGFPGPANTGAIGSLITRKRKAKLSDYRYL